MFVFVFAKKSKSVRSELRHSHPHDDEHICQKDFQHVKQCLYESILNKHKLTLDSQ